MRPGDLSPGSGSKPHWTVLNDLRARERVAAEDWLDSLFEPEGIRRKVDLYQRFA